MNLQIFMNILVNRMPDCILIPVDYINRIEINIEIQKKRDR